MSSAGNKCKLFVPTFVIIECYAPFACTTLSISLMYAIGVRNVNAIEKKRGNELRYSVCFTPLLSTNCHTN